MAIGYTRQSAASMVDKAAITAEMFNAEFNQVQSAFNAVTGHAHDGTAGGGAPITLSGNAVTGQLPVTKGGTGVASLTAYGVLLGNGAAALTVTNAGTTDGHVLRVTGGTPSFGPMNLADTDAVAGILPITNGGTGGNSASTARTALELDPFVIVKHNRGAIVSPTASNDVNQGYDIGSIWINVATDGIFMCIDNTALSAVWKEI